MNFDLLHIFQEMGLFARGIVSVLLLMAAASITVFLERLWAYARSQRRSNQFAVVAGELLDKHELQTLRDRSKAEKGNPLAELFHEGLDVFLHASLREGIGLHPVELAKRALDRRTEAIGADLRRGHGVLASVGSVAPFVGLLGTVVGIIAAFQGIAREGSGGLGAVSAGIAEALVVTALGLVVAIPAVLVFNYLSARADGILLSLMHARGELVDHLEDESERNDLVAHVSGRMSGGGNPERTVLRVNGAKEVAINVD